ncbi:MAG: hypothetical protein QOH75_186 [Actinomycetota bacterium]|jgi:hypothetical protein|nr:hypothetical protein [Actinomycetota bacterium]
MTVQTQTSGGLTDLISGTRALRIPGQTRGSSQRRPAAEAPIAAVRLSGATWPGVVAGLHQAGLGVLDINAHQVGPRPHLIVLELPDDDEAARRLVTANGHGAGRLFVTRDPERFALTELLSSRDELALVPCHPLQIAVAALRVSGSPEHVLLEWSRRVFDGARADDVLALAC